MSAYYKAMPPNYYDKQLATSRESVLRNRFVGLNTINEVRCDYVTEELMRKEMEKLNTVKPGKKSKLLSDLLK